ncbi:hypothetical protein GALMADRAFT_716054 [Galerina marginata CBS 339.88]|uniref:Uncharacterized protein n=1 Tax=Galerina marginata (strain CBS 339.88) TaxID=685588 RepID=A0A067TX35_GALM3|nr:hypothetical protein GALMADRAFT_716054 [Galerina marginata CBS 339.88]
MINRLRWATLGLYRLYSCSSRYHLLSLSAGCSKLRHRHCGSYDVAIQKVGTGAPACAAGTATGANSAEEEGGDYPLDAGGQAILVPSLNSTSTHPATESPVPPLPLRMRTISRLTIEKVRTGAPACTACIGTGANSAEEEEESGDYALSDGVFACGPTYP